MAGARGQQGREPLRFKIRCIPSLRGAVGSERLIRDDPHTPKTGITLPDVSKDAVFRAGLVVRSTHLTEVL